MNEREREILLILQEESAEVIQAVSKIFRFGHDTVWDGQSNKDHLTEEIGDFFSNGSDNGRYRYDISN